MPTKDGQLKGYERDWVAREWLKYCMDAPPLAQVNLGQFLERKNLIATNGTLYVRDSSKPASIQPERVPNLAFPPAGGRAE